MEPVAVLELLQGAATRRQLLARSSRRALDKALADGAVLRIGWGRYALPALPDPVQLAISLRGQVSHASAAELWGLESVGPPGRVHITVPRNAHRRPSKRVQLHYAERDGRTVVTSEIRTVIDCARTMPFREGLAIADSALRQARITAEELATAAGALKGSGAAVARRVARHADARAANPFESALRGEVITAGLLGFEPQFKVPGLPYRVDLADPARRVVLEADSFEHHGSRQALDRDCRRYDELVGAGWTVLRFSWEQVMFESAWLRGVTAAVVTGDRAGGGRCGTGCRLRD